MSTSQPTHTDSPKQDKADKPKRKGGRSVAWTAEREQALVDTVKDVGENWAKVSAEMEKQGHPQRTADATQQHWNIMTSRATALGVPLDGPIALAPFTVDEDSTLLALNDLTQAHAKACGRNSAAVSWSTYRSIFSERGGPDLALRLGKLKSLVKGTSPKGDYIKQIQERRGEKLKELKQKFPELAKEVGQHEGVSAGPADAADNGPGSSAALPFPPADTSKASLSLPADSVVDSSLRASRASTNDTSATSSSQPFISIVLAASSAVKKATKRDRSSSSTPSTTQEARGLSPAVLDWPCVSSRLAATPADLTLAARAEPARASPNSSPSFSSDLPLSPAKLPRTGDSLQLSLVSSALSASSASQGMIANPSPSGAPFSPEPASNFPLSSNPPSSSSAYSHAEPGRA